MSLLWNGRVIKKQLTRKNKPSPTIQGSIPDSARSQESSPDGGICRRSVTTRLIKGISLLTSVSGGAPAGMTVEASIVLPLFLFFFLNLGCAMEMIRLHGNLQLAVWQIGSRLSVYGYALESGEMPEAGAEDVGWWEDLAGLAISSTYVRGQVVKFAGREYLDASPLTNGADGLQFWESRLLGEGGEMDIIVTYSVSPWSDLLGTISFRMANRYYGHIWNGYALSDGEESGGVEENQQTVYVTENGTVYHSSTECTHLRLTIRQVSAAAVGEERNESGAKYYPCERCSGGGSPGLLYITKDGKRYHFSRDCSGLKRTMNTMTLEEAQDAGYPPCSRCGG